MKLLGVDFGLKKVGLALAQSGLAQPLMVVPTKIALKKILSLSQAHQIEKIIIGKPTGPIEEAAQGFGLQLGQLTGLPIEFQDETLTSQDALAKMIQSKKRKKVRTQQEDAWAAACLLEAYLEKGGDYV